jgi:UDP-N-acetylmuramoylalanine--D-glutamate ligase
VSDELNGRRVIVLGFGRQGRALARWLPTVGTSVVVTDNRPLEVNRDEFPGVEFVLGEHPEQLLDGGDLLCVSGGVPLDLPIIQVAQSRGILLTNDAQLFLERCPAPVIGITGSAGKTTTTALVGAIMERAGYTTWVGGNIGDVLLDVLPEIEADHYVVMELSSFQLDLMTCSPPVAAVLNVTPNHLDRHGTMEAYTRAKANILAQQQAHDFAVLGRDDAGSYSLAENTVSQVVWFSAREIIPDGAFMAGQRLLLVGHASVDGRPQVICERDDIPLRGDHNVLNVLAACAITGVIGVTPDVMRETIRQLRPIAHRLEIVRVLDGVTFVNDSIATAPERVIAALRSYHEPLILLAGGKDKNLPWDEMIRLALLKAHHIVAFGQAGDLVVEKARQFSGHKAMITRVKTVDEAVAVAASIARPGDVVLLSPGGTSYDAYTDFVERGEHFRQLVSQL